MPTPSIRALAPRCPRPAHAVEDLQIFPQVKAIPFRLARQFTQWVGLAAWAPPFLHYPVFTTVYDRISQDHPPPLRVWTCGAGASQSPF